MKEISIEQKDKACDGNYRAYTELINRLENVKCAIKEQNYGIAMDVLCKPYPEFQVTTHSELKESEDEKIRKELIFYLQEEIPQCSIQEHADKMKEFIAWLEKQGEQKPKDKYTFKSIPRLLEMVNPTDRAKAYCQQLVDSLLQEGYDTDAKIVSNCLKQMNGEKVAMATMDEQKPTLPRWKYKNDNTPLSRDSIILNKYGCVAQSPCGALVSDVWVIDYDELAKLPKEEIEKQGNHESVQEVEPTPIFKVGDILKSKLLKGYTFIVDRIQGGYYYNDHTHGGFIPIKNQDRWELVEHELPSVEPKFKIGDIIRFKGNETLKGEVEAHKIVGYDNELYVFADGTTDLFCEQDLYELVEQKPADKAETKFHEGDWIVFNGLTLYVKEVVKGFYRTISKGGIAISYDWDIDNVARLWTIHEAMDGDVLSDGTTIFIFKDLLSDGSVMSYCDYDKDSGESDAFCPLSMNLMCSKITPVTKEQRSLLFAKMKEAGYQWDAEKKELKKIVQNFTSFERCLKHIMEEAIECGDTHNLKADAEMLLRVAHKHAEWSEEDENHVKSILSTIECCKAQFSNVQAVAESYNADIDWLKFIKERYTWKPSEEQMKALAEALSLAKNCGEEFAFDLRTLHEHLKKL